MAGVKNARRTRGRGPGRPFAKGNPGRAPGLNKLTREAKALAHDLVTRPKYLAWITGQLDRGRLPVELQKLLWYYAYGKPPQAIDLNAGFDLLKYLARPEEARSD